MARSLHDIGVEMIRELPPIDMAEVWKNSVDDYWHRAYSDTCPICRTDPCMYKE